MTFSKKKASDRDSVLLMYLKDMAVWHFIPVANPNIDIEYREIRYNKAIAWLKNIQGGKIVPQGWIQCTGNERRVLFSDYFCRRKKRKTDTN